DGIRDDLVTGVQTCALPIYSEGPLAVTSGGNRGPRPLSIRELQIAKASFSDQAGSVSVQLNALGNENAIGFSVSFDPAQFTYQRSEERRVGKEDGSQWCQQ